MKSEMGSGIAAELPGAPAIPAGSPHARDATAFVLGERWMPSEEKCVASVRRFVRDLALDWRAAEGVAEVAELLVSELSTNSLTHGSAEASPSDAIHIKVSRKEKLMTVEVYDSCVAVPTMRRAGHLDTGGRGIAIVEDLSCDWGWTLTPTGKSVWFQLPAW